MKKLSLKIYFTIALALIWISLMVYNLTGAFWHELIGLGIGGLFLFHIGYNISLLKKTFSKMFKKGHSKMTFKYVIDILLLILTAFTIISGVLISREILTFLTVDNIALFVWLHNWAAYLSLIFIAIHLGLHLEMYKAVLVRPFQKYSIRKFGKVAWNLFAVAVMGYGFFASLNYHIPAYNGFAVQEANATTDKETTTVQTTSETAPTLEEYLGNMICTACPKRCSLLAPQCGRGVTQANTATEEYYVTYPEDSSSQEQDQSSPEPNQSSSPEENDSFSAKENTEDVGSLNSKIPDIAGIMGFWIAGTFYVSKIIKTKKDAQ